MSTFINIAEEDETTRWQYRDPDTNTLFDSVFLLRVIPSGIQKQLRKKHTTFSFKRGRKDEDLDWMAFNDDCMDYAIVSWENVQNKGADLPCERAWKLKLPDKVKAEIVRLCLGKELGQEQAGGEEGDEAGGHAAAPPLAFSAPTSRG